VAADGSLRVSNVLTPDWTIDEGYDILQKLSALFPHHMEHISERSTLRDGIRLSGSFVRNCAGNR
jgi:hypothetical protein